MIGFTEARLVITEPACVATVERGDRGRRGPSAEIVVAAASVERPPAFDDLLAAAAAPPTPTVTQRRPRAS